MSGHTPGPLVADCYMDDHPTEVLVPGFAGQMGTPVATCHHNWNDAEAGERRISWKEAECNARLFSAASELLEALQELLRDNTGEVPTSRPNSAELPITVSLGQLRRGLAAIAKATGGATI